MGSDATEALSLYQLWAWVETNKKQVAWGAVALAAATFIAWFFFVHQDAKEIAACEALSAAAAPQVGLPGAGAASAEAYLRVAATYPNSSAAARAVLLGAASLFVEGKYDQAKLQFERFTREHRDSPFMGQALLGIAACQDALEKTNEATVAYKNLVERHAGENVAPQARFALARLYEEQNKPEQALQLFEEVNRSSLGSSIGSEAGMRVEELRLKYPSPAPAPTPTAAPTNPAPLELQKP